MATLVDTHCHLTADAFREDLGEVVSRAAEMGVDRLVCTTSDAEDAADALERVADGRSVWATVGIHPHEAEKGTAAALQRVRELAADDRVVALGECGLDYYYDNAPRALQRRVFDAHVELAHALGLPLVVHSRAADDDTAAVLDALPSGVAGVLHCFTGGRKLLEATLRASWHVSLTGIVTFPRFGAADLVRAIPRDRVMIETDAPYLAPVPHRSKRNEPSYVVRVAEAVAQQRGDSFEEVARYTTENAVRFFGLGD